MEALSLVYCVMGFFMYHHIFNYKNRIDYQCKFLKVKFLPYLVYVDI